MSWHYSQALEAAYSEANSSGGKPCALSKSTTTLGACSSPAKTTDASNHSQSGMMCEPSTDARGAVWWMSCLAASRAKTSAQPATAMDSTASDRDSGEKCGESWAKWDRDSCSWRTAQLSLFGGLEPCSAIWPRWGMMRAGECWALATPAHLTKENASGSLPTLTVVSCEHPGRRKIKPHQQTCISAVLAARDNWQVGGQYSPSHAAWLMGWPDSWTNCGHSVTDKFRMWCGSLGLSWHPKIKEAA